MAFDAALLHMPAGRFLRQRHVPACTESPWIRSRRHERLTMKNWWSNLNG